MQRRGNTLCAGLCGILLKCCILYGGKWTILFTDSTSHRFARSLKYRCSFWHRPICRNLHRTSHSSWQSEIEN